MLKRKQITAGSIGLITMAATLPLQAEEIMLEEILITAEKKVSTLQDSPISIINFNESDISQLGITEITGFADSAPNVLAPKTPSSNSQASFVIRGVGSSETSLATDPSVSIYINDVLMGRSNSAALDVSDVARIEILRGPQGTLYGRNTTGGAVNVITKKPTGKLGLKQKVSVGSYGYRKSYTGVDLPEWAGIKSRINYVNSKQDSYFQNTNPAGPKYLGDDQTQEARLNLLWESDELSLNFSYDYTERNGHARPFQLVYVNPNFQAIDSNNVYNQAAANVSKDRQRKFNLSNEGEDIDRADGAGLTVNWDINENASLKSVTGYRTFSNSDKGIDLNGGTYSAFNPTSFSVLENFPLFTGTSKKNQNQFSQELNFQGMFNNNIEYMLGLFFFKENGGEVNPQQYTAIIPPGTPVPPGSRLAGLVGQGAFLAGSDFRYTTDNQSQAIFGQTTYNATDALALTAGLRYTKDDKEVSLQNSAAAGLSTPVTADNSWSKVTGTLIADYEFSDDLNSYAKYSTGYNAGGFNVRARAADIFKKPYDEETIKSFEIGTKSKLLNRRIRLNGSLFYNQYEDIHVYRFKPTSAGASIEVENAGEADIYGLELEMTALISETLRVQSSYGYTKFDFKKYESLDPLTGDTIDVSKSAIGPRVPEHSFVNSVIYEKPNALGLLTLRLDQSFTGSHTFDPVNYNNVSAKARNLINTRISLSNIEALSGEMSFALWGKNLTDKEYIEWGIDLDQNGYAGANFGAPRSFGLDVSYVFK